MSYGINGLNKAPKNGCKNDIHHMPHFVILMSIGLPLWVISYAINSYLVIGLYVLYLIYYFRKISVNHGNNFRVIHLMTRKRVPLWLVIGVLSLSLSSSVNRESENYTNELAAMQGKCSIKTLDKDSMKAAGTILRIFSLGTWIFESLIATVIEKGGQAVGIKMPPDSLLGMILINLSREQTGKHAGKVSAIANDILATECKEMGVWAHTGRRFLNGIWMTLIYIFSYPIFFLAFPGLGIYMGIRSVAKNQH